MWAAARVGVGPRSCQAPSRVAPHTRLVLPSDVPHGEADVLVLHSLNVEAWGERAEKESVHRASLESPRSESNALRSIAASQHSWRGWVRHSARGLRLWWPAAQSLRRTDGWNSRHNLAQLQLVQDGGLTGGVKTDLRAVEAGACEGGSAAHSCGALPRFHTA